MLAILQEPNHAGCWARNSHQRCLRFQLMRRLATHDTCLCRRAKRLKKLKRMLTSSSTQVASTRLTNRTWMVLGLLVGIHIAGYAIISTQVQTRFA